MRNYVIAVSGPPGAGSTTTAKLISERLKIFYFSPGQLFKDISKGAVEKAKYVEVFNKICQLREIKIPQQKASNDSSGAISFWQTEFGKSKNFHEALDELQITLSKNQDVIIDGKLSLSKIKSAKPKIWLTASLEERARRTGKRDKIPVEDALDIILKRQETERKEWSRIYGLDYFEQERIADLIIDTTYLMPEQVVKKIIKEINLIYSN